MKHIKIENSNVYYRNNEHENWKEISEITGDDILKLLEASQNEGKNFEIDEYNADLIHNECHKIIYKSIYSQFKKVIDGDINLKEKNNEKYRKIIDRYSGEINIEEL